MRAEREMKRRSVAGLTLRPCVAAVSANDAPHGREADAGALELAHAVQALKRREQLPRVARVEADAVVAHEIDGASVAAQHADLDARGWLFGGELPRVAQEIL